MEVAGFGKLRGDPRFQRGEATRLQVGAGVLTDIPSAQSNPPRQGPSCSKWLSIRNLAEEEFHIGAEALRQNLPGKHLRRKRLSGVARRIDVA